jgi:hypothetical protein
MEREPVKGFGLSSYLFEEDQQFRVQNSLVTWTNQEGTVIGIAPGTELSDRKQIDYYIVKWDDGGIGGISPAMAIRL